MKQQLRLVAIAQLCFSSLMEVTCLTGIVLVTSCSASKCFQIEGRFVLSCQEWKLGPLGPQPDYGQSEVGLVGVSVLPAYIVLL